MNLGPPKGQLEQVAGFVLVRVDADEAAPDLEPLLRLPEDALAEGKHEA